MQARTRLIIVTIRAFPALFDVLDRYPKLADGHYAVIADEDYSYQIGSAARNLKAI